MDGDRLAEQLKGRVGQMDGDSRSRNEDGSWGPSQGRLSPPAPWQVWGAWFLGERRRTLGIFRAQAGSLQGNRVMAEGARGLPAAASPQSWGYPKSQLPETPNPGGLPCLWAEGTRCSHPRCRCSVIPLTPSMPWGTGLSRHRAPGMRGCFWGNSPGFGGSHTQLTFGQPGVGPAVGLDGHCRSLPTGTGYVFNLRRDQHGGSQQPQPGLLRLSTSQICRIKPGTSCLPNPTPASSQLLPISLQLDVTGAQFSAVQHGPQD